MSASIRIKRGLAADIGTLANGEFYYATDTDSLYIGEGGANILVGGLVQGTAGGVVQPRNAFLEVLSNLSGAGLVFRQSSTTGGTRTMTGTANQIAVANGDGTSGIPTWSLAGPHNFTSLTDHGVLVGSGTSPIDALAVGTNGQLLIGQTGADPAFASMSGDATIDASGVLTVGTNKITNAKFRQSAGLSVVGRASNSTGDVADITAGTDFHSLRRNGTVIEFGQFDNRWNQAVSCKVYNSGASYTVANNTITAIPFNAEVYDAATPLHDNATNNTRITVPTGFGGRWMLGGSIYSGDPTGFAVSLYCYRNSIATGTLIASKSIAAGVVDTLVCVDTASAGDYWEWCAYQNTGVSKNLSAGGILYPVFWAVYLGTA